MFILICFMQNNITQKNSSTEWFLGNWFLIFLFVSSLLFLLHVKSLISKNLFSNLKEYCIGSSR